MTTPSPSNQQAVLRENKPQPVYFLSHGGGPWPYMNGAFRKAFLPLERALNAIPATLPQAPTAVLVITGHWEEVDFTVSTAQHPGMIYDYYGFPEETYHVRYPAPGHPALAEQVAQLLEADGWTVKRDNTRGYDHGTFCMMQAIYPQADIPIVQLSMKNNLDPEIHFAIGQSLNALRTQNILILASGQSFHNLSARHMRNLRNDSLTCDTSLRQALQQPIQHRKQALIDWMHSSHGHFAHPRADHLIPLFVVLGAANTLPTQWVFGDFVMDFATSNFCFFEQVLPTTLDRFAPTSTHHSESVSI